MLERLIAYLPPNGPEEHAYEEYEQHAAMARIVASQAYILSLYKYIGIPIYIYMIYDMNFENFENFENVCLAHILNQAHILKILKILKSALYSGLV